MSNSFWIFTWKATAFLLSPEYLKKRVFPYQPEKKKWSNQAIVKILTNEKYVGNVFLGKSYTEEFPIKKRHENRGDRETYLAEGTHPAIIAMEQFLAVMEERKRCSNMVLDEFGEYHRATQRYSMCKKQTGDLSTQQDDLDENDE